MAAPSASSETALSVDEVTDGIRSLSVPDQLRLKKASKYLSFGTTRPADDLRQEAMRRAVAGTRKCPRHVPIVEFLFGVMRSIASTDRRAVDRAPKLVLVPSHDLAAGQIGVDPRLSPEDRIIQEETAAEHRAAILALFADDLVAQTLAEGVMDGMEGSELQELTGLGDKEFATKRRLVRRRIDRAFPNGVIND